MKQRICEWICKHWGHTWLLDWRGKPLRFGFCQVCCIWNEYSEFVIQRLEERKGMKN